MSFCASSVAMSRLRLTPVVLHCFCDVGRKYTVCACPHRQCNVSAWCSPGPCIGTLNTRQPWSLWLGRQCRVTWPFDSPGGRFLESRLVEVPLDLVPAQAWHNFKASCHWGRPQKVSIKRCDGSLWPGLASVWACYWSMHGPWLLRWSQTMSSCPASSNDTLLNVLPTMHAGRSSPSFAQWYAQWCRWWYGSRQYDAFSACFKAKWEKFRDGSC